MKYIKNITEELDGVKSIEDWCEVFNLKNYIINNVDNTVDVNGFVDITYKKLENIPIQFGIINGIFNCFENKLITLEGSPRVVGWDFDCSINKLVNLIGGPKEVGDNYICIDNNLISLEGYPEKIGEDFECIGNPIYEIYKFFYDDYEAYKDSLDYNYLRGTNIIKLRFQESLEEAGIKMPESIPGYKYI